jgi:DNA-binding FadR family transcriptional regulator
MMINSHPPTHPITQPNLGLEYEFLTYLVETNSQHGDRIPALGDLSKELNISVSKLREQLEVARSLGVVTVRPRTGIHRQEYDFLHAVRLSLFFAVANDIRHFDAYSELRKHVEKAFWHEAITALTDEDKNRLRELVTHAWEKLRGNPIRIPHVEHRQFHLTIFSRIDNAFVRGILEAYWDAYEAVQLNAYADYTYLNRVWSFHERIAEAIIAGNIDESLKAFDEHTLLLPHLAEDLD